MGGHSQHLDQKYGTPFKPGENIRDMRKRILNQLEHAKYQEHVKKQASRRRGQSMNFVQTMVAAPSASESRKHMKVISVQRTGQPATSSIFSIAPMQHRSQLSHVRGGRGDYSEQLSRYERQNNNDSSYVAAVNTSGILDKHQKKAQDGPNSAANSVAINQINTSSRDQRAGPQMFHSQQNPEVIDTLGVQTASGLQSIVSNANQQNSLAFAPDQVVDMNHLFVKEELSPIS